MFAIYIQDGDNYTPYNSNTFPSGYIFNPEKSGCIDNNGLLINDVLSYDNGIITVETPRTAYCYIYFDKMPPINVSVNVSTDGVINTLPTYNKYKAEVTCDGATASFSNKYQRIEISQVSKFNNTCNLNYTQDQNTYTTLISEVESKAQTNANGYRYSGKTPNNWVWFNNEKWRIIGSIPVCLTASCGTSTTNLVKIIRSDSIGSYAYDASSTTTSSLKGAWGENTLYSLLNTHYYASSKDTMNGQSHAGCYGYYNATYQPKPNCDYSDIGILSTSYYGRMVKNVYWNTGASANSVKAATAYTNEKSTQTVSGYIGLMSASDWGYAADSSYHNTSMSTYTNATKKATETSWIFNNGYEWTSLRYSSGTNRALYVTYNGHLNLSTADYGYAVRPVVYLDSSVYVISGSGSESDPYIIGM